MMDPREKAKPPTELQRAVMIKIMHNMVQMLIVLERGHHRHIRWYIGKRDVSSTVGALRKKGYVRMAADAEGMGPRLTELGLQALKELQDGPATNGE